jgi:hypothetical protein
MKATARATRLLLLRESVVSRDPQTMRAHYMNRIDTIRRDGPSATKTVRPREVTVESRPQLQTGFAQIVSDDFPVFHALITAWFHPPLAPPCASKMSFPLRHYLITTFDGLPTAASVVLNEISASSDCAGLNGAERRPLVRRAHS